MADKEEVAVLGTGGQVDEIVMALIDGACDKDPAVRQTICTSIQQLGKCQPALVLSSCHSFLVKHAKLGQGHRVVILNCMEAIIQEASEGIDQPLAKTIIEQASAELTQSKDVIPEWQGAASGLLVALGASFCNEVMEELQKKFQPGVLPHFFVVQTMANLAAANVYGMVPFFKVILGTMLPMLGMAKQDNMRWVFSAALCKFSEAILDYVANIEKAPDTSVRKEFFSSEIDAAYDIVFNVWLQSRESKLRVMIIEALGQMAHIMTKEKLVLELTKLLQAIMGLYKRHQTDPYHITQGLSLVLGAAAMADDSSLELHLDNLLGALFPQMCQPVDYSNPVTVKNHNELLRCYTVLVGSFSEKLLTYLLQKLEVNNDRSRVATLSILRHLINSAGVHLEDKKPLILAGLKVITTDPNNKVKKELAQTVMAMCHHGYLELEGGQLMIEFVVRQCCPQPDPQGRRPTDPEYVSNDALRAMCENVLQLMSTTVDNMDFVLWPYLLEFIVPEQYTDAVGAVCRCVASIAQHKRDLQSFDSEIDFEDEVNIPKPPALIARMMVMAGQPFNLKVMCGRPTGGRNRGAQVLNAMKALAPNMHKSVVELWDTVVPKMVQYFEDAMENEEKWSLKNWEDLVLKMVSKTLEQVEDEEWTVTLGEAFGQQLPMYANCPEEKNFTFKALGVVMRKSAKKDFVSKHLDLIFSSVKHGVDIEREGCAAAMGYVAASHLDSVLAKLDAVSRNESAKRSSGLFGFIKDSVSKSEVDEKTKATLVLCYGYATLSAPPSLIKSRLDTTILKAITSHFPVIKDMAVKHSLIQTTELLGRAMHPEHLQSRHAFTQRGELLTYMQNYLKMESPSSLTTDTRALTLKACSTLIQLDPVLTELELFELMKASLDAVMALPPGGTLSRKSKEESYQELIHQEALMAGTLDALQTLQAQLLLKDMSPSNLENIFKHLHRWMLSQHEHERERAVQLALKLFSLYLDKLQVVIGSASHFSNLGASLGRLIPRCTDPCVAVRQTALDCIQVVLKTALRYQGHGPEYKDTMVEAISTLRERVKKSDATVLFSVSKDVAKLLSRLMPGDQLMPFLHQLYDGLTDPHDQSSSGVCVVLNDVVKARGAALPAEVEAILMALHGKLREIVCQQTQTGTLRTVRNIAAHHLLTTLTTLLNYDLPFDEYLLACWRVIAEETSLLPSIFSHLLELLTRSLPYEERPDPRGRDKNERTAMPLPLAATCALREIFLVAEAADQVMENYPRLLAAIMVRIASTVGVHPPKPSKDERSTPGKSKDKRNRYSSTSSQGHGERPDLDPCSMSVDALRAFLVTTKSVEVLDGLTEGEGWFKFTQEDDFPEAFTALARLFVIHEPRHVANLITVLNPTLGSVYEPQRVMTAAVFAELINQKCAGDLALVEMLVNSLLGRLVDTSHSVRRLCIRGLGNVASVGAEPYMQELFEATVQRHSTTVLSAMMAGMDDKEDLGDTITLEAMSGLSRILAEIDEAHIRAILINIALRIRPCFEKDKADVRAAAFTLFGNLSRFGDGPSKTPFLEQIHTNFISLLLHLNDPDREVRKACKYALRLLGPLVGSEMMSNMFQRHLLEDGTLHYGEFMNDLSKVMIHDFADKLNFYIMGNVTFFKSCWPGIKSNAAMLVGFLLGNASKELYAEVSKEHIVSALVMLLKDPSTEVRIKAAEAMSRLHNF